MLVSSEQWFPCELLCAFAWLDRTWDRAETSPVGAPWCIFLQSGLIFFLVIFFFIKIDFPLGPSLLSFFVVAAVLDGRFDRVKLHGGCVQSNEEDFALIYRSERFF